MASPSPSPRLQQSGPIGVLDSGVGGISILKALHVELPNESFVYIADQAHLPYGPRPLQEIRAFVHAITEFLQSKQAKMVVVACNAASAASLHYLRDTFPRIPFIGMEPAVKPAAESTRSGVVAVLTTAATAGGPLYESVMARFANGVHVRTIVCPELVFAVEEARTSPAELRPLFDERLAPILAEGVDQLVLGCTHFPFAAEAIEAYVGSTVTLVDPSPAIARQTQRVLDQHRLKNASEKTSTTMYYTTGDVARFESVAGRLLQEPIVGHKLRWTETLELEE